MSVTEVAVTLRVLKHELRTPINHIIGYSELLIEDLSERSDRATIEHVLAIGRDLLGLVNAELDAAGGADEPVAAPALDGLRSCIGRTIEPVLAAGLGDEHVAQAAYADDVRKILDAAARLDDFARTGAIRASE
jgi:signal transduction histidine kinase